MPSYRLYAMTRDGHIRSAETIDAESDGEAIHLARLRLEHADIELWCGKRRVAWVPKDGLAVVPDARTGEARA
jgi:hypothetical protein